MDFVVQVIRWHGKFCMYSINFKEYFLIVVRRMSFIWTDVKRRRHPFGYGHLLLISFNFFIIFFPYFFHIFSFCFANLIIVLQFRVRFVEPSQFNVSQCCTFVERSLFRILLVLSKILFTFFCYSLCISAGVQPSFDIANKHIDGDNI